jgi:hypothetical protein
MTIDEKKNESKQIEKYSQKGETVLEIPLIDVCL